MLDKSALDACSVRDEIGKFIESALADHGTGMDSGGGGGAADLWFTVGGIEYCMTIKPGKEPRLTHNRA